MAAAAGIKESVSLSLSLEVNDFEVEEEVSNMGHASLGRRNLNRKMVQRAQRSLEEADLRGSDVEATEDLEELLCARPVSWGSSGHNGTS